AHSPVIVVPALATLGQARSPVIVVPTLATLGQACISVIVVHALAPPGQARSPVIVENNVTRLQALVDKKKVVVTEAMIREALRLDDAEGVDCLTNEEIFAELGDLSTHTTKYTSPALTQKVFANMRRVGKGFFGVETPLFEGMLVENEIDVEGDADEHVEEVDTGDAACEDVSVARGEVPAVTEEPSIPSPTPPTPPPQAPQDIFSTS
nr:hypothetical protein [Tanacetum cinerariifolium]